MDKDMIQDLDSAAAHVCRLYEIAVGLRQNARFGEAINAFRTVADICESLISDMASQDLSDAASEEVPDAAYSSDNDEIKNTLLQMRSRAIASIELLQEINGFVNTDLMNP